ncbi:MAG: DsbA family protein [Caulobacterales bacterium]|jgi:2-hydroxychromene-2-carboxylate isomerase
MDSRAAAAQSGAMSASFEFYFSFRSPYSYLASVLVERLMAQHPIQPVMKIVTPIAIRIPGFFKTVNPLWPPYLARDTWRIAEMHAIAYRWPRPDPIVMDLGSGEVAAEQPYIWPVSRMAVAAARAGQGFAFVRQAAALIWDGATPDWHQGGRLEAIARAHGIDPAAMPNDLDAEIAANEAAQARAGHWGVPLFVFQGEPFFGQDRLDVLLWRMGQAGALTASD